MKYKNLIGRKVGSFCVQGYEKGAVRTVTEKDMQGKWTVFFFYPADFTFVCPTELGDLADYYEDFTKEGCQIFSVSTDSEFVHKAWADASETIRKIPYTMLADTSHSLSKKFGVLVKEAGQALRATFLVSPEGIIKVYEVHDMGIGRNAKELLRKLRAAKFVEEHGDSVCPAKWEPGEDTLLPSLDLVGKL